MKKILLYLLTGVTFLWAAIDISHFHINRLHEESIFILTAQGGGSGGTAFELQYGRHQFTVTNAHVCDISKDGLLEVHSPYTDVQTIHILSKSPYSDLCLLDPVKELPAFKLRLGNFKKGEMASIWGHPLLKPLKKTYGKILIEKTWADVELGSILDSQDAKACRAPKNRIVPGFIFPACIEHVLSQETNIEIRPGSSGSPVLDQHGKVGGVAFAGSWEDKTISDIIPWSSLYIFLMNYTQEVVACD